MEKKKSNKFWIIVRNLDTDNIEFEDNNGYFPGGTYLRRSRAYSTLKEAKEALARIIGQYGEGEPYYILESMLSAKPKPVDLVFEKIK